MASFQCDPRDRHVLMTCDCPCAGGKYQAGSELNIGRKAGRVETFPRHSFPITEQEILDLSDLGFYWTYGEGPFGVLECVACDFCFENWSPDMDLRYEHFNYNPICPFQAAVELGYDTEVDIVWNKPSDTLSKSWIKPVDPTRFVCDPEDYFTVWPLIKERFEEGSSNNVGYREGRLQTYPLKSIDYSMDVHDLVDSGFRWSLENEYNPRGTLTCIGCQTKINNWNPGSDADAVHRTANQHCQWLRLRDAVYNMEMETYFDHELNKFVIPGLQI